MKTSAAVLLLTGLLLRPLAAQTVQGNVVDADTNAPLGQVAVRLLAPDGSVVAGILTTDAGTFALTGPAGDHELVVERIGYATERETMRLRPKGFIEVTVLMHVQAIRLDSVNVQVGGLHRVMENGGYYQRKRLGGGTFLERESFMKTSPRTIADVIQRVGGARVTKSRDFTDVIMRSNNWRRSNCMPLIYVDGMRMTFIYNWGNWGEGRFDLSSIPASDVEAVEVYTSKPSAPTQYIRDDSECGAVLIWMRYGEPGADGRR